MNWILWVISAVAMIAAFFGVRRIWRETSPVREQINSEIAYARECEQYARQTNDSQSVTWWSGYRRGLQDLLLKL